MQCGECHKKTDEMGLGLCSVPMFSGGVPAGFCNEEAYGKPTDMGKMRYGDYVPGLACALHGGPTTRVFRDGNQYCAVYPGFINLQESLAGFGDTPELARQELENARMAAARKDRTMDAALLEELEKLRLEIRHGLGLIAAIVGAERGGLEAFYGTCLPMQFECEIQGYLRTGHTLPRDEKKGANSRIEGKEGG